MTIFLGLARLLTVDQTTANQERERRQIAGHMGCEIVKVYKDHGISGAKDRPGVRVIAASTASPSTQCSVLRPALRA